MSNVDYKLSGKTVVITGASGYIGSSLTKELEKYSVKIIRVSRKKLISKHGVEDWILDLNSESSWDRIVAEADVILHLAGNTSVYAAEHDPENSLISTIFPINHLISAAKKLCRIPRVVYASTVTIYGLVDIFPVSETVDPNPITMYDLHKLFAEQQLAMANKNNIINSTSLRLANVYGPSLGENSASDRGVLNKVALMAIDGKDLTIYGDGSYVRDYVYIDDVVSAFICTAASSDIGGRFFNVATQKGSTLKDVFGLIADNVSMLTGRQIKMNYSPWPEHLTAIERRSFIGDINALHDSTGWVPQVSLKFGVNAMVKDFMYRMH